MASETEKLEDVAAMTDKEKKLTPETLDLLKDLLENGPPGQQVDDRSYLETDFARAALTDPWVPVKYLRLAHHKPRDAAKLFHETLKWRRDDKTDRRLQRRYPKYSVMKKNFPFCWHGTTRYGHPIHIDVPGFLNVDNLLGEVTVEELVDYHVTVQEYMVRKLMAEQTEKTGRRIHQIFVIVDLQNAGRHQMRSLVYDYLKRTSIIDQQHYPDALVRLFIINAPWLFQSFWAMVRGFLNQRTRNKTHILGTDYHAKLREYIDDEQLPCFMGGKCPGQCTQATFAQCHAMETNLRDRVLRSASESSIASNGVVDATVPGLEEDSNEENKDIGNNGEENLVAAASDATKPTAEDADSGSLKSEKSDAAQVNGAEEVVAS